jgi:DNA-binding MarR family transcriptional regulator
MNHSFNTELAKELGVNAAIILNNIAFWTEKKLANDDIEDDGLAYIYNSVHAWNDIFPYLTQSAIKTAMNKLISAGYLVKRNDLNKIAYDRTNHYAMTENALEIFNLTIGQKSPMEKSEIANELVGNRQPIPVINTDGKPVINTVSKTDDRFEEFWGLYDKKTGKEIAYAKWKKLTKKEIAKIFETLPAYLESTPNKQYRKNPATYINQKVWNDEIINSQPINTNQQTQYKFK